MVGSYSHCCHHLLLNYNSTANFDVCYSMVSSNNYSLVIDDDSNYNYSTSLSHLYSCSVAYDEVHYVAAETMAVFGVIFLVLLVLFLLYRLCRCFCCRDRGYSEIN